jgi:hypothetical protein
MVVGPLKCAIARDGASTIGTSAAESRRWRDGGKTYLTRFQPPFLITTMTRER